MRHRHGPRPDLTDPGRVAAEELSRGLTHRQIQLIAIGGAIGVGLFLGSASAIGDAGPAVLVDYVLAGVVVFFILRALGEMAIEHPVSGSFATYAEEEFGPWAGYVTGWVYWLMWMTTALAEITAVGLYVRYFAPDLPQWVPALGAVLFVVGANLVSARMFGLTESWFALVKVVAIVAFIVSGIVILGFGAGGAGDAAVSNLWDRGGFFPEGVLGPLIALQIVTYSFLGVEMIGVTAGEAQEPRRDLPLAINRVVWRILLFYVGAIAVVLMLIPWNELNANESPFVVAWEALGIPGAAGILTAVVICSALSSCNTGVFTSSRMLWAMSGAGEAPRALRHVSTARVPRRALTVCGVVLLLGVVINAVIPEDAFTYITSIATVAVLWVWGMVSVTHLRYRAKVRAGERTPQTFRMPGSPWTNALILGYLLLIVVMLVYTPDQRIALVAGAIVAVALAIGWPWVRRARERA